MKTLMPLLLSLAMLFTLTACGSQGGADQEQNLNSPDVLDGDVSNDEDENYESLYGKVTSVVGNEIELALAELPDDNATDGDSDPVPVELPGGIVVTQKEPINVESMEYTGESLTFTLPAGTQFYSDGQETTLSAIKKGSVVSVTVDNREDMNIQSVEILC